MQVDGAGGVVAPVQHDHAGRHGGGGGWSPSRTTGSRRRRCAAADSCASLLAAGDEGTRRSRRRCTARSLTRTRLRPVTLKRRRAARRRPNHPNPKRPSLRLHFGSPRPPRSARSGGCCALAAKARTGPSSAARRAPVQTLSPEGRAVEVPLSARRRVHEDERTQLACHFKADQP